MVEIKIDLNRITRRQFREFTAALAKAESGLTTDELTGNIVDKVVTAWPYDVPISAEAYLDLPLQASLEVDQALSDAFEFVAKKK